VRAVVTIGHGGLEQLSYRTDWPDPVPGADEVLIAVGACGLNNTDVNTRVGWYSKGDGGDETWTGTPLPFPRIQGADVCGRVVACGAGAPSDLVGRRVLVDPWFRDPAAPDDIGRATYFGSEHDGGYAELTLAPTENAVVIDSHLSDVELASFPTSSMTALNMLERAKLKPGETVLVTGASGGVGTALLQIARAMGATPVGVSKPAKGDAVRSAGAEHVVDRGADPVEALAELGITGVDVVADVVGGDGFGRLLDALRPGGRYTCAGAIGGAHVLLDLRTMYLRDLTLYGATVPGRGCFRRMVRMVEDGRLRPLIGGVFPLDRVRDAQEAFLEKRHVGNLVVDVAGD
jgi:NADPH:quinone reductase-like Zn-dependent oxidoreductase